MTERTRDVGIGEVLGNSLTVCEKHYSKWDTLRHYEQLGATGCAPWLEPRSPSVGLRMI
jgi:hypothetical protein